jgi:ribose 5-phosphate isomerase
VGGWGVEGRLAGPTSVAAYALAHRHAVDLAAAVVEDVLAAGVDGAAVTLRDARAINGIGGAAAWVLGRLLC